MMSWIAATSWNGVTFINRRRTNSALLPPATLPLSVAVGGLKIADKATVAMEAAGNKIRSLSACKKYMLA